MKKKYWAGFDLGGTKMLAQLYDWDFKPIASVKRETEGFKGLKSGLERIIGTLSDALAEVGSDSKDLTAIGIACPGVVDPERGVLIEAPNLGWSDAPMRSALENAFRCPVIVSNDVDAGVYGEYRFGAAKGARCAVGVFPGTGIGGGAVLDDKIVAGRHATAMEIGHIPVVPDGPLCGCGERGCLEAVASRLAISAALVKAAYRGQAPHLLEVCGTDISRIKSRRIAYAIESGDTVVEEIVSEAACWLGVGVATIVNLIAPDIVVLGGGLVEAMPDLWLDEVRRSARARSHKAFKDAFKVVSAKLGDHATVLGAAAWARYNVEKS